jgi:hypothetical protein
LAKVIPELSDWTFDTRKSYSQLPSIVLGMGDKVSFSFLIKVQSLLPNPKKKKKKRRSYSGRTGVGGWA